MVSAINASADPCEDFYEFACGGWQNETQIPSWQSGWAKQVGLVPIRRQHLVRSAVIALPLTAWKLMFVCVRACVYVCTQWDGVTSNVENVTIDLLQKDQGPAGRFYRSCMDTDTIQKLGAQPVQPWLQAVDKITDHATLMQALVQFAIADINVFWSWWVDADSLDSSIYSFFIAQGGISMPDQTYYTEQTAEMQGHRDAYMKLIKDIMILSGRTESQAQKDADNTMDLETAIAKSMTSRAEERDEHGKRMTLEELQTMSPSIDWSFFLAGVGAPRVGMPPPNSGGFLVVKNEGFFKKLDAIISDIGLDKIKSYLRWQAVYNYAPFLDFNYEHKLLGMCV